MTASSDLELFWGLRGAGPNFGIITSAVVKSYPATEDSMEAWTGSLVYSSDKLEDVAQVIQDLDLRLSMNVFMYLIASEALNGEPTVVVTPFLYKGNATSGQAAFVSLYALDPIQDSTSVLPYNQWNAGDVDFCA